VGQSLGKVIPLHLKIDTGMGRLGVWHEHASDLYSQIEMSPHLRLAGVFTHFASPDDDPVFTAEQRRRFTAALKRCPGLEDRSLFIHADNSAGLESIETAGPFNAVRIGLLQFGVLPRPGSLLASVRTEPVFSFHTRVGLVKRLPAGTTVSYGRTRRLMRDSKIAVLCAGYADGLSRACSNSGFVLIHGKRCPILGRVTMDQTIVDVTDVPGVACADEAVIVGRQGDDAITLGEFSEWAQTIPWETLTSISKRVPRVYRTSLGL